MADLILRQAYAAAAPTITAAAVAAVQPACATTNEFDGRIAVRVSAIFVILAGSLFGAAFPVYAGRHKGVGVPEWAFFVMKYFGSGVIIATAFIHLLAPACNALTDPCLTGPITAYSWAEGIPLITIFILFFVELMAMRYATFGHNHDHDNDNNDDDDDDKEQGDRHNSLHIHDRHPSPSTPPRHTPGEDHLSHTRNHTDPEEAAIEPSPKNLQGTIYAPHTVEDYAAQMTAIFILEFGVIFHSIFIGLTLAVAGPKFNILYVVLAFHQTFEGLGLGSRLAATPWPPSKRWTPYAFALGYGLSTPLAIAVGLGVRNSYVPGSQTSLIVSGVFDSISAGILIYTGLVELMAHEFMFSNFMRRARLRVVLYAFGMMCLGAGLMACLGRWA